MAGGTLDFTAFYRGSFPRVYRATWLLVKQEEVARDATQEAFERAYVRWRRLQKEPWALGWVMTTSFNLARSNGRRTLPLDAASGHAPEPSSERVDLSRALAMLAPRQQHAVVLHYIGDLPISDIASVMNVSEGTVKAHLAQGRRALRSHLEETDD